MARLPQRFFTLMLPLTLAAAMGCVGRPVTSSETVLRPAKRQATTVRTSPSPGAKTFSSQSPLPKPSASKLASPSPSPSPSPQASLAPVMAQPVAINTDASGFSDSTRNFVVVSAATGSPAPSYKLAVNDGLGLASVPGAYKALSVGGRDGHAAFRAWERAQFANQPRPATGYRTQATTTLAEGTELPFYVITSFDQNDYEDTRVTARLAKVGKHCYVFVDKKVDERTADAFAMAGRVAEIAETFDTQIYPTNTRLFGAEPNPGVDGDTHVYLLLSPAVGNYGQDTTLGYFSQRDEYLASPDSPPILQHSNGKEMLYISSRVVLTGSAEDYLGTIAHEFQHMINFNQKVLVGKNRQSDDLWIDEGMAMYAIEANGYGLRSGGQVLANHVKRYQQEPEAFSLTEWTGNPEGIGYGPVYLFMVYMADRFSESIINEIVASKGIGIANIEAKLKEHGTNFRRVFHDWSMANLLDGRIDNPGAQFQYMSLKMMGATGKTRLSGITPKTMSFPSSNSMTLRPYTATYMEMPRGEIGPRFTFTPLSSTGVQPRVVLP